MGQQKASKLCTEGYTGVLKRVVYQLDPRHVDVLVKEIGLESANAAKTPAVDDAANENSEALEPEQSSRHGSHVALRNPKPRAGNGPHEAH